MTQLTGQALQDAAEQRQKDLAERGLEMSINSIKVSLLLETATAEDHAKHTGLIDIKRMHDFKNPNQG